MSFPSPEQKIWQVVAAIPPGRVASYAQVALLAGLPRQARRVGRCLGQLPAGSKLPWHRVLCSDGRIAFALGTEAHQRQAQCLLAEGVAVKAGRVSLIQYQWQP